MFSDCFLIKIAPQREGEKRGVQISKPRKHRTFDPRITLSYVDHTTATNISTDADW